MEFTKIKIDDLRAAEYNPRKDLQEDDEEYQKIKKSLQEFGYVDPVIVNKLDNTIIGGHQRVKVLKDLGHEEIQCIMIEIDKDKEKALNIALNKITGEWDQQKLQVLLQELTQIGIADLTGFDIAELSQIVGEEELEEDDFDVEEELKKEAVTQKGDLWLLGKHRVLCGDSTSNEEMAILMENTKTDLIVTDPPYNVDYGEKATMLQEYAGGNSNRDSLENDHLKNDNFREFLLKFYEAAYAVAKEGCPIYVFHADTEGVNFREMLIQGKWKLSQVLIWVKNFMVLGRQDYNWKHEPILYGWKLGDAHKWYGGNNKDTVLDLEQKPNFKKMAKKELVEILEKLYENKFENSTIFYNDRPTVSAEHPTMKPVKLIGKIIQYSSKESDIILDCFGGSGTTLIAAEQLNRICNIMELEEKYVDVIVERYIELKGSSNDVFLIRDGKKIPYLETQKIREE